MKTVKTLKLLHQKPDGRGTVVADGRVHDRSSWSHSKRTLSLSTCIQIMSRISLHLSDRSGQAEE